MYPMTELLTGLLFWYAYYRFGLSWEFGLAISLIFVTLSAGLADLFTALDTENFECGIIPDSLIVVGLIAGFGTSYMVYKDILFPVYGATVGFLGLFVPAMLYQLIRKREGMGFGDIKLIAVCGAFLGLKSVFFLVFGSALLGAIIGITWQLLSGKKDMMIPFGPFITTAALIYLFFGTLMDRLLYGV